MKFLRLCTTALVLLLGATIAHAQGFQEKSFPAGPPKPEVKYHMIVPEGVTITNKKGEVYTAGQTVLVPGANVTILEPAYVKEQMKDPTFKSGFVDEELFRNVRAESTQLCHRLGASSRRRHRSRSERDHQRPIISEADRCQGGHASHTQ